MKYLSTLLVGLLLLPMATFAATYTPAQISAMEKLLSLLEQELQVLLAEPAPATGTIGTSVIGTEPVGGSVAPVSVSVINSQAYRSISGPVLNTTLQVTNNTGSPIYVPAAVNYVGKNQTSSVPGISFSLNGVGTPTPVYNEALTGTVSCAPQIQLPIQGSAGYVQACVIPANGSSALDLQEDASASNTNEGYFTVSVNNLSYSTTDTNPSFTILPVPTNVSTSLPL